MGPPQPGAVVASAYFFFADLRVAPTLDPPIADEDRRSHSAYSASDI